MVDIRMEKLLIANRGEIAARIQRACRKLGIRSVTVASEADRDASFAQSAEELAIIGPAPAQQSYLNGPAIIAAARAHGCQAIHPGYGFLSENSVFAAAVLDAGLVFVGPTPQVIASLGSKVGARALAARVGVPLTEGSPGDLDDTALLRAAKGIGFPLIIKAVAGGGGRGMRVVRSAEEMRELLPRARAEARKFFSDDQVFIERYIENPRHVEVQIFGDRHGAVTHFGTRECSVQRRHQKLVEEAPALVTRALERDICDAALALAKAAGYSNAGTVEFLISGNRFYFLEINTRIQVEHPVTEEIHGVDLIDLQLRIARGERLKRAAQLAGGMRKSQHAIEFRIYAEDPEHDFAPSIGTISAVSRPTFAGLREETAIVAGDKVSPYYDAMISKLIVTGRSRAEALGRATQLFRSYRIEGLLTTIPFHRWLLSQDRFRTGEVDIDFVDRSFSAETLREFAMRERRDPAWRSPDARFGEYVELQSYQTTRGDRWQIEIRHLTDGTFFVAPLDNCGRRAAANYCRRSNGRAAALRIVVEDVLEAHPPRRIFQNLPAKTCR